MVTRIWDPEGHYETGFVKEYHSWILEVSFRQHTLWSFIIFAKRAIEKISNLKNNEVIELIEVMKEFETTLAKMNSYETTHELTLGVSYQSNSVAVCPASSIP